MLSQKATPVLVVLLILASFAIGSMWTKIQYLSAASGGTVAGSQNSAPANNPAPTQPAAQSKVTVTLGSNDAVLGNPTAPVTMVEFADFQCPFCERFFTDTWPSLKKDYIDTGKLKFVYKNLPINDRSGSDHESHDAANAALCAKDQNKFWEYHDVLFKNQNGENQGAFSRDNLKKFAANLGLDTGKFNQCLDTGKYNAQVQADFDEASKLGINGTPTLVVNGNVIVGAQPYATFKSAIDAELAAK